MAANVGYLFNKDYYDYDIKEIMNNSEDGQNHLKEKNRAICNMKVDDFENVDYKKNFKNMKLDSFSLKTSYPGLLIGSGYARGLSNHEDFKIGFYFDYTTGVPIIPASSVKGVLRSAFKHQAYIKDLIKTILKDEKGEEFTEDYIVQLKKEIFCGEVNGKQISIYERDIFHDAIVNIGKNKGEKLLKDDYITPHKEDPLKNPQPLKFIKVAPNIVFDFYFDLKDSGSLNKDQKKELFKRIILDLGIGAKTNVGYGYFDEI